RRRDPGPRSNSGPRVPRGDPHDHGSRAPRSASHRATARAITLARLGRGRHRARERIPDRERARGARELTIAAAPVRLAVPACGPVELRERLSLVDAVALIAVPPAFALVLLRPLA